MFRLDRITPNLFCVSAQLRRKKWRSERQLMRTGLYPGTFDPVTLGHIDILKRACSLVDHLVVGVAINADKEPLFSLRERVEMLTNISEKIAAASETEISVHPFGNLLVQCAQDVSANIIIRGLRAVSDFEYEFQMVGMNRISMNELKPYSLWLTRSTRRSRHGLSRRSRGWVATSRGSFDPDHRRRTLPEAPTGKRLNRAAQFRPSQDEQRVNSDNSALITGSVMEQRAGNAPVGRFATQQILRPSAVRQGERERAAFSLRTGQHLRTAVRGRV